MKQVNILTNDRLKPIEQMLSESYLKSIPGFDSLPTYKNLDDYEMYFFKFKTTNQLNNFINNLLQQIPGIRNQKNNSPATVKEWPTEETLSIKDKMANVKKVFSAEKMYIDNIERDEFSDEFSFTLQNHDRSLSGRDLLKLFNNYLKPVMGRYQMGLDIEMESDFIVRVAKFNAKVISN